MTHVRRVPRRAEPQPGQLVRVQRRAPFATVCVWDRISQTAYTVENGLANTCGNNWLQHGNPSVVWSPNTGAGPNDYCVRGER